MITSLCKTFALAIDPLTLVLWFGWGRIWSRFSRCCSIVLGLRWARVKGKTMGNNEDGRMGLFFSSCPHPRLSFFSPFLTLSCWDGIEIGKVLLRLQSTRFFCVCWNLGFLAWEKCILVMVMMGTLLWKCWGVWERRWGGWCWIWCSSTTCRCSGTWERMALSFMW